MAPELQAVKNWPRIKLVIHFTDSTQRCDGSICVCRLCGAFDVTDFFHVFCVNVSSSHTGNPHP